MTVADVVHMMDQWAPRWIAWERDNVGLQVGDRKKNVRTILLCLDVTEEVVSEAIRRRADLIVSHHPLLFRPPSSITTGDRTGSLILRLAQHDIALYSAHTNLDFTAGGVSAALARMLGLRKTRFLAPLKGLLSKIAVFVPESHVSDVMKAMSNAGAGTIGEYSDCSFQVGGTGTFRGSGTTNPFVGRAGALEATPEVRLEMVLPRAKASAVIGALRQAHPYEEVAYDLYTLENESPNYGMGAIGELESTVRLNAFLTSVRKKLKAESVRFCGNLKARIRTVAVCGGSGSDLLNVAIDNGADAFVTADVRYHTFHDAAGRIVLIDAGHWETEHGILPVIAERLHTAFPGKRISVNITKYRTSPLHTF